jgi:hypothetical protein
LALLTACGFEAPSGVPIDAKVDAAPDARRFDPRLDCPASYDITLSGQTSRYRMILEGHNVVQQNAACAADQIGATHLVALDDVNEIAVVQARVNTTAGLSQGCVWVGGVQLRDQVNDSTGWLMITGGPLAPMWDPAEPNDGGDNVENNVENYVILGGGRASQIDVGGGPTFGAMCECDGKPVDPAATAAIAASL